MEWLKVRLGFEVDRMTAESLMVLYELIDAGPHRSLVGTDTATDAREWPHQLSFWLDHLSLGIPSIEEVSDWDQADKDFVSDLLEANQAYLSAKIALRKRHASS